MQNVQNVPKLYPYVPRISQFTGNYEKSDVTYAQWRHEVKSLLVENQPQDSIAQAIRISMKGSAFEVLMHLYTNVPIQEIIDKYDMSFDTAQSVESLLQECYESRQKNSETITKPTDVMVIECAGCASLYSIGLLHNVLYCEGVVCPLELVCL